jgi:hypothetical protein
VAHQDERPLSRLGEMDADAVRLDGLMCDLGHSASLQFLDTPDSGPSRDDPEHVVLPVVSRFVIVQGPSHGAADGK